MGYWWKILELCATQIFQAEHLKLHRNVLVLTKICPLTENLSEIEEHRWCKTHTALNLSSVALDIVIIYLYEEKNTEFLYWQWKTDNNSNMGDQPSRSNQIYEGYQSRISLFILITAQLASLKTLYTESLSRAPTNSVW